MWLFANLIFLSPSSQTDSSHRGGLKRRNHSVSCSEAGDITPVPIFLQQGSAVPSIPQLAGTSPIDLYARILFPLTFALFNLGYWYIYLTKETIDSAMWVILFSLWYCLDNFDFYSSIVCLFDLAKEVMIKKIIYKRQGGLWKWVLIF